MADLGQGVHAALVRPRVPRLILVVCLFVSFYVSFYVVFLSLTSVALITSVQSSARIRGLKPDFRVKIFVFLSRHNTWQWTCFCDLQSDNNHSQNKFNLCCCWSIYIPKKFAKQLGFPLFAEIKFSRFNLTWRTAAKEVNLHTAQEDKLFKVGRQSREKWRDFHPQDVIWGILPTPCTTLLSEVIVWKFRPAHASIYPSGIVNIFCAAPR